MEIFYLNLDRRKDRDQAFLAYNMNIAKFSRLSARDGELLSIEDLVRDGKVKAGLTTYSKGSLGAAFSHEMIWDRVIRSNKVTTVAEDDAIFNYLFCEKYDSIIDRLPEDWDIILHGWNFDSLLNVQLIPGVARAKTTFYPQSVRAPDQIRQFQESNFEVTSIRLINAFGLACYSISPKGAKLFKDRCFPLRKDRISVPGIKGYLPNRNIDTVMNKHYHKLKAYVTYPPLVITKHLKEVSDTSRERKAVKREQTLEIRSQKQIGGTYLKTLQNITGRLFGIGLSQTGTTSLTGALRMLGFASLQAPPTLLTQNGPSLSLNWDVVALYQALTDAPIARFYRELDQRYPNSKFILTIRDQDSWLNSCQEFFQLGLFDQNPIQHFLHLDLYNTVAFDPDKFLNAYLKHKQDVLSYFNNRESDLLVFDLCSGESWEKLCSFLDRPIPSQPFPNLHVNRK